jgi:hypothetical protein
MGNLCIASTFNCLNVILAVLVCIISFISHLFGSTQLLSYFEVLPQLPAQTKRKTLKRPMDVRVLVGHVHQFKKKQI